MKIVLANILYYTGISWFFFLLSRVFYGDHVRVVNYHGTPACQRDQFDLHLKWYRKWYQNTNFNDLISFLSGSGRETKKPSLIISFDDGKRNNFDIAKPLLERYGFTGWFFIPVAWVDAGSDEQRLLQEQDTLLLDEYPNERVIVNRTELRELAKDHVVGCHTMNHHRMNDDDTDAILMNEIVHSKALLEEIKGNSEDIFCWVGGEEKHYTRRAAKIISSAGYKVSFTTNTYPILRNENPFKLERSNIETDYPMSLVLFQLSGLMDLLYVWKRRRLKSVFC
jgi:peptidoglycan/xylan/chitin deacetylase (PgdA/CDA1 family)